MPSNFRARERARLDLPAPGSPINTTITAWGGRSPSFRIGTSRFSYFAYFGGHIRSPWHACDNATCGHLYTAPIASGTCPRIIASLSCSLGASIASASPMAYPNAGAQQIYFSSPGTFCSSLRGLHDHEEWRLYPGKTVWSILARTCTIPILLRSQLSGIQR